MLEPVQKRDDDRVRHRRRVDLVERLLELMRFHGDQQDANRLRQLLTHLHARDERVAPVHLEREPGEGQNPDHVPPRQAHGVDAGRRQVDGERTADGPGAEDGHGVVHVSAGSETRFTTFQSE